MSTIKANQWLNPDGTENYKCRAWVNFNGTGTVAIRAAGNVSSITDNGTGDYTVNFASAMPDASYSVTFDACANYGVRAAPIMNVATNQTGWVEQAPTTSAIRVVISDGTAAFDPKYAMVNIFR